MEVFHKMKLMDKSNFSRKD